ncbi:MAG: GNAT family N-acetyltransferase [Gemmatimonadota bacterium]
MPLDSSALRFRFAAPSDLDAAIRLAGHSFPGPARSPDWWRDQLDAPLYGGAIDETLFLGEESGRVVAGCQLHPMSQWIGGQALPVAGVGAVAVAPTHRRRRIAAQLMTAAMRAARERGDAASILYPFRASFYRNLGYGRAGEVLQYRVAPRALPVSDERLRVELLETDTGRAQALDVYSAWIPTQTGQLERSARRWAYLCGMTDRLLVGYRADTGALEGYALAAYRMGPPPDGRYLDVLELLWTTPRARRGLYGWLASLDDQWERLLVRALPEQRFGDLLADARLPPAAAPSWELWEPAATLLTGTMFRILDMRRAWELRSLPSHASMLVSLAVVDAQIPENARSWRLTLADGRAAIDPERPGTGSAVDLSIELDISTLSRLYIGSLPATAAHDAGLLACERAELLPRLDAALALPQAWTFDRF